MTRSRLYFALLAVAVIAIVATAVIIVAIPDPAPVSTAPIATPDTLSAADQRMYAAVALELRAAAAEARALTTLGQERSRNLIAIRTGQTRLQEHLDSIDGLFGAGVSERFSGVAAAYHPAAAKVRAAMSDAEAGFLRFDWEMVGTATEQMAAGTAQLEDAVARLDRAAGATPVATPDARSAG